MEKPFTLNARVCLIHDPRHQGTIVAFLSRNFHGACLVRVRWDSGPTEDLPRQKLALVRD